MHATVDELEIYLGVSAPPDAERLLQRATDLIDGYVFGMYEIDSVTDLPTETRVRTGLRDAVCAQVEWWQLTGDEADVLSGHTTVSMVGSLTTSGRRRRLAPRAQDYLQGAGLLQPVIA